MYGEPGDGNITLAMDQASGDNKVQFPVDAINASETKDEAGVASTASGSVSLTAVGATIDNITSATISCPTNGYVLAIGTIEASVGHVFGIDSAINFGVSDVSQTYSTSQDIELRIDANMPVGNYDYPVTVHGVFPVNAGNRTFYLVGDQNSTGHSVTAFDPTLSLIFVPTNYGSVSGSRTEPGGFVPDFASPAQAGGLTPEQVMAEQTHSASANQARVDAELAAMRERMARLERELAAEVATNEGGN